MFWDVLGWLIKAHPFVFHNPKSNPTMDDLPQKKTLFFAFLNPQSEIPSHHGKNDEWMTHPIPSWINISDISDSTINPHS